MYYQLPVTTSTNLATRIGHLAGAAKERVCRSSCRVWLACQGPACIRCELRKWRVKANGTNYITKPTHRCSPFSHACPHNSWLAFTFKPASAGRQVAIGEMLFTESVHFHDMNPRTSTIEPFAWHGLSIKEYRLSTLYNGGGLLHTAVSSTGPLQANSFAVKTHRIFNIVSSHYLKIFFGEKAKI